jgi:hypothetical protein
VKDHLYKLPTCLLILSIYSPSPLAEERDVCHTPDSSTNTIDITYNYLNTKFCQPANWFDSFFVDTRATEDARAGTMVRWYQDITWEKSEPPEYGMKLTARFNLPKVSKKLKIVIESDDEDTSIDSLDENLATNDNNESTVGLRYDILAKDRSSFNVKVTIRPSIELRYRYSYPFSEQTLARFTQKLYQKKEVTGESTHIDIDHSINQAFLIRWANLAKFESDINDFELGTGLTLYQYISKRRALSYKAGLTWYTKSSLYVYNTHLSATYRQNILRKWLFYELIPEVNWDKEDVHSNTENDLKFTFRLEVLFKNI